jgi:hypothetical protein
MDGNGRICEMKGLSSINRITLSKVGMFFRHLGLYRLGAALLERRPIGHAASCNGKLSYREA